MATQNYQVVDVVKDTKNKWIGMPVSTTQYIELGAITHLDSVWGLHFTVTGVTSGAGTPTIQFQHTLDPLGTWNDLGAVINFSGNPITVTASRIPVSATDTLLPFCRLKVVTPANATAVISKLTRTIRGTN